ncbi:MAG TPA: ROK family protein [Minicystis sp.]|nr:ROK family protein [Minicystis sp.]
MPGRRARGAAQVGGLTRPRRARAASRDDLALGVDLGGTKIEVALLARPSGEVLLRTRAPTPRDEGYGAVLAAVAVLVRRAARDAGVDLDRVPLGVGMPGAVTRAGLVKNSNTTCLNGRPFRADLARTLGRPVAFDNDANCFALAETLLGAAAPHREGVVFGVILGTGVGGGVVVFGRVWEGLHGIAGEWGHHAVFEGRGPLCYCGRRGCLETFASGPAVEADYARRAGAPLPLAEIARRRAGDVHAAAAIEGLLAAFGRGLANVIDVLDPSAVVLGGGVSNLDVLYDEGRARRRRGLQRRAEDAHPAARPRRLRRRARRSAHRRLTLRPRGTRSAQRGSRAPLHGAGSR